MGRGTLTPQDLVAMKIVSANLQRLLKESGIKQADLATTLDIPKSSLNEYVKGRSLPKAGNVQKLADYFGLKKSEVDPRFSHYNYTASAMLEDINKAASQLDEERQELVLDFAHQQIKKQQDTASDSKDSDTDSK
ncbi:XRE family transcriptional regulator [Streptococcus chenjunshii]|uniref:XRE family transcriptional regulator n=1 Tax=Streptococcus chenjunshii TaxID=2173853 RepID=A0A372KRJ8_9STRE|nr:helix-turn-helix transcriptional regulator [Streptococcus chenjunshii]AXQ78463.1 XRE family transcriptional regulator [Streptococcus chenjunshii]RFU52076.1 XRE family transcriptional regulator [Streptococcus chenjunshii]RFU54268.1 XRE family transcriptional regulator [Streptococcus chenjunshii]